ncbi:MAG: PD-(D/E)XK nuclease family transposase, partial [Bacteroidota bacterium]
KKLDELETRFDKWLYILRNLHKLDRVPGKLKERIFEQLFETAEIAKFNHEQLNDYEESLKYYRDLQNSLDKAFEDGIEKGMEKGIEKVAIALIKENVPEEMISSTTGLNKEQIGHLKQKINEG